MNCLRPVAFDVFAVKQLIPEAYLRVWLSSFGSQREKFDSQIQIPPDTMTVSIALPK